MQRSLLILVAAAMLAGCVIYDPVIGGRLTELFLRTREVIADGDAHRLSLTESRRFLRESLSAIQTLHQRAALARTRPEELAAFKNLEERYAQCIPRDKPLNSSNARELQAAISLLERMQTVKLHSGAARPTPVVDDTPTADDSSPPAKDTAKKRDCDDRDSHHHNR